MNLVLNSCIDWGLQGHLCNSTPSQQTVLLLDNPQCYTEYTINVLKVFNWNFFNFSHFFKHLVSQIKENIPGLNSWCGETLNNLLWWGGFLLCDLMQFSFVITKLHHNAIRIIVQVQQLNIMYKVDIHYASLHCDIIWRSVHYKQSRIGPFSMVHTHSYFCTSFVPPYIYYNPSAFEWLLIFSQLARQ